MNLCRWSLLLLFSAVSVAACSKINTANQTYLLAGKVVGLTSSLQLQNANDILTLPSGTTSFSFTQPLAAGASYDVVVKQQPAGQTCTVANGKGAAYSNINNIVVTCAAEVGANSTYYVSATVTGLKGTLVLLDNAADALSINQDGLYAFATPLATGATYDITVGSNPEGQLCTVSNGQGVIDGADVNDIQVACQTTATSYSVSVTVSGLNGLLVLADNSNDTLQINSNGTYAFATPLLTGQDYNLVIVTNPNQQSCVIQYASGVVGNANVNNIEVSCQDIVQSFNVGVAVTGLIGSLTLQNDGHDSLTMNIDGHYQFPTLVPTGAAYAVTILHQPTGQTCTVSNGSGTILSADINNVSVSCVGIYTVSFSVLGVSGTLVLQNNGGDNLTVTADGTYTFATTLLNQTPYVATILTQPANQRCILTNGSGTINAASVGNASVVCVNLYTVGLSVSGLSGTLVLQNNGGDNLTVIGDGTYTFATPLVSQNTYAVTLFSQTAHQLCTLSQATGTIGTASVGDVSVSCVDIYTVSVNVSGLVGTLVLQNNGGDNLHITSQGSATFATSLRHNDTYAVTVSSQPTGQFCAVSQGSGSVNATNINNINVACLNSYTVSVGVSGLSGTLVLQNNGEDNLSIISNGTKYFASPILDHSSYDVTILSQPAGQFCTVSNNTGMIASANVGNITVSCANIYSVSVGVSGLSGTLILQNNGGDNLSITSNGSATFATPLFNQSAYAVSILTQPTGQQCTITGGSGTIAAASVSNINIACTNIYTVSVGVSGLSGTLVLQNNSSDNLNITSNGTYMFSAPLLNQAAYHVAVLTQPTGQWCTVTGGVGSIASANILNVDVSCVTVYPVTVNVSGLSGTLMLQDNGVDNLSVTSNGSHVFDSRLVGGASYAVSVSSQPQGQLCAITNGNGVIASNNIPNIGISCQSVYTVSVNVSGLTGTLVLQNNSADNLSIQTNGISAFSASLFSQNPYAVTVLTQPAGQLCNVTNGSGNISSSNITSVNVACVNIYTVSANVSGLSGTLVLQNNGGDNLSITSNGTATFASPIANGASYAVTVLTQPSGQLCSVASGSGSIASTNVNNVNIMCVDTYTISANISGFAGGTLVLQNNGGDSLNITASGTDAFATALLNQASYNVTVLTQPNGQICVVSNGSGTVSSANVNVACTANQTTYTITASVSGLSGTLVLQNNGGDNLNITTDGVYTFTSPLVSNASYNVAVLTEPTGQLCNITNGSGTIASANVNNISVSCVNIYTVSANVSGLSGTLVLQNNGGDNLSITNNGTYTFATALLDQAAYAVGVFTQPAGQLCTITSGSGTIPASNISNVAVSCVNVYTVSTSVTGLSGTLVLQNNGTANLIITSSGNYTFAASLLANDAYAVTVLTQPNGQHCSVNNGSGTVSNANISNISVSCANVYTVSLSVSGLSGTLVLQDNSGDNLSISSDGSYTFGSPLLNNASYAVSVLTQPNGQVCTISNASGTISSSNVSNVAVSCVNAYTVSLSVSGLSGMLVLQNNGGDNLSVVSDGSYTFATSLLNNVAYAVTVLTQPNGQSCTVSNGSGTIAAANITNIAVACVNTYTVSLSASGLSGMLVLQNNGGDNLSITSNGAHAFATSLLTNAVYDVTVFTQPSGQTCTVNNASGTIASSNISNISVVCVDVYTVSTAVSGLSGTLILQNNGGDNLSISSDGSYTFATTLVDQADYDVAVLTQPSGQFCAVNNASGTISSSNVTNITVSCVNVYTVSLSVSGSSGALVLQNNGTDNLSIGSDGSYTFATSLADQVAYDVTVLTQPTGQLCTVSNGSDTISSGNVSNITVTCVDVYTVAVTVASLSGTVVLQNNTSDNLSITSNGTYTFATSLLDGDSYDVTVLSQPIGQICSVVNDASGTISSANVADVSVTCVSVYTVSASVSGLSGTLVLQNNSGDNLSIGSDGTYTFATSLLNNITYAVTVLTQPNGQLCTLTNGSGTVSSSNVGNISVSCVNVYTISATVSGLSGGTLILQNNGGDNLSITSDGTYTFATSLVANAAYATTVFQQALGQDCIISNGSGTIVNSNITNVSVSCSLDSTVYSVSVNITGFYQNTLVLQNNGGDNLSIGALGNFSGPPYSFGAGTYTFPATYSNGQAYSVSVASQHVCNITNGDGTINSTNVVNINLVCTDGYPLSFSVSGSSGPLTVQNVTADNFTVPSDGAYTFPTVYWPWAEAFINVLNPPTGQTCTVNNNDQNIDDSSPNGINITCSDIVNPHTISVNVSGLSGSLVLQNNSVNNLAINNDGAYTFSASVPDGSSYCVSVLSFPPNQQCSVQNACGTVSSSNVSNISVVCSDIGGYSVSVNVSGFLPSLGFLQLIKNNNANTDPISVIQDGVYTFSSPLNDGDSYSVTATTQAYYFYNMFQPSCTVENGSGNIASSNVSNINVVCEAASFFKVNNESSHTILMTLQDHVMGQAGAYYGLIPFGSAPDLHLAPSPFGVNCFIDTMFYPYTGQGVQAAVNCTGTTVYQSGQDANVVLGQADFNSSLANAGSANVSALGVGPNAQGNPVVINSVLYTPDPNNNRILGFSEPLSTSAAASIVVGQPDNSTDTAGLTAGSFNKPYSVASDGNYFIVADSVNNRVLIYNSAPSATGYPTPSAVIGQSDYVSNISGCSATNLNSPQDVSIFGSNLVIADTGNNRVLLYQGIPTGAGVAANIVYGQPNMNTCTVSGSPSLSTLNAPSGAFIYYNWLLVADTGNNRVLGWSNYSMAWFDIFYPITSNGVNADYALGQPDGSTVTAGSGQNGLSSPSYVNVLSGSLVVADTGNNRVLIYDYIPQSNTPPNHVLGQASFSTNSCNNPGSGSATIDGLCSPMGLGVDLVNSLLIVNDSGNNRYVTYAFP